MPERGPKRGSGEGSVYQRSSDGRWVASFVDVTGRRQHLYADSDREVRRQRRTALQSGNTSGRLGRNTTWSGQSQVGTPPSPRKLLRHLHRPCKQAGIRRMSFHTLRHSAATIMLAQGVPDRVIMDVLGHSTTAMIVRYQHVTDSLRDAAADAMDEAFRDLDPG